MIKEILERSEPVACRILENSLRNDRVAHSYLFSGEYSPLKIEAAYLLAQSIVEGKHDFACEECDTCKRIRNNNYFDVIYVDGYEKSIVKDDVEYILDEFSRTSLESYGKKVYILANINNSSNKVLNMILKFMEEPGNDNTFGIFITDNKENLLPTIVSRCQNIPFMTRDFSYLIKRYTDNGFDEIDGYLLSDIFHRFDQDFDLNDEAYLTAKEFVYKTIDTFSDIEYLPVLYSLEFYKSIKDKKEFDRCVSYYLHIMIRMIEDSLKNYQSNDEQYNNYLDILRKHDLIKLLEIFENAREKYLNNAEKKLLLDSAAYEILCMEKALVR
ncbi:MAG: hypothetical protein Q4D13_07840 [Erysipelotrichaceae bacterium]|nr:hypothetical protein [Erysipelotrichaceae bacterium]